MLRATASQLFETAAALASPKPSELGFPGDAAAHTPAIHDAKVAVAFAAGDAVKVSRPVFPRQRTRAVSGSTPVGSGTLRGVVSPSAVTTSTLQSSPVISTSGAGHGAWMQTTTSTSPPSAVLTLKFIIQVRHI